MWSKRRVFRAIIRGLAADQRNTVLAAGAISNRRLLRLLTPTY